MKNEPAFPVECDWSGDELRGVQTGNRSGWATGLSIRDYFAAKALQSLLVNHSYGAELQRIFDPDKRVSDAGSEKESPQEYVGRLAYSLADAMLSVRSRSNP